MEPVWTITIPNSVKYLGQRSFSNIITNGAANKPVGNFIIGDGNAQSDFSLYIEEEGAGLTTPT